MAILGIDVGGTFTDAVLLADGRLRTAKVPTVRAQEHSVVKAAVEVGATGVQLERFTHGTTIATNALLERKGARTAFVGTAGFEHVLHLRRQTRGGPEPAGGARGGRGGWGGGGGGGRGGGGAGAPRRGPPPPPAAPAR